MMHDYMKKKRRKMTRIYHFSKIIWLNKLKFILIGESNTRIAHTSPFFFYEEKNELKEKIVDKNK